MAWYQKYLTYYNKPCNEVPINVIESIKNNILKLQAEKPLITISIIAFNEADKLVSCIWSISDMICQYPVEIIGIDNNSTDNTFEVFESLGIKTFRETKQGPGHARNKGLFNAKGKYCINIDSDSLYPKNYAEIMVKNMIDKKGIAAYGFFSFIPGNGYKKLSLYLYEFTRDIYLVIQSIKRPELSVRGSAFAHETEIAKSIGGFRTDIKRGEDGSLALALKEHGKLLFVKNRKARPVTDHEPLTKDGSLIKNYIIRGFKALKGFTGLFISKKHYEDTDDNIIK